MSGKDADGAVNRDIVLGENSLQKPVEHQQAPIQPIWQGDDDEASERYEEGLPLDIKLHGSSGSGGRSYRAFGDASMGWREGLPFCFGVRLQNRAVELRPTDRTWIGRILTESSSSRQTATPAIETWWYGTSSTINDRERKNDGVPTNYTERQLLWIIDYIQQTYKTDPNRTYGWGSSMGASGLVSFGLRHPEIFTAVRLHVPAVTYNSPPVDEWESKESRMELRCGDIDHICSDGMSLRERLDGVGYVSNARKLPYIVVSNGRSDYVMGWWKAVQFYRALRDSRHGFIAYWNDGGHGGVRKTAPDGINAYDNLRNFDHLSLDKSYIAFSNCSADKDPGSGARDDGDIAGSMNLGLSWEEPTDTADSYEVLIRADTEIHDLPVTVDVTPRRLQSFSREPGEVVIAKNIEESTGDEIQTQELVVNEDGLLTFPQFTVTCAEGNHLVLQ
ncbi:MAG: alpha/beta hydrolase-fold protein [Armatimonadota bacterium]